MGLSGSLWGSLALSGALWGSLGLSGALCGSLGLSGHPSRKICAFSTVSDIIEVLVVFQGAQITRKFTYATGMGFDLEANLICWKSILTINLQGIRKSGMFFKCIGKALESIAKTRGPLRN